MTQPDAVFLQAMAGDGGVVYERAAVEAQGDAFGTPGGKDACTGPLTVDSWSSGSAIVLTRFDEYWDADHRSKTGRITFRWAADDAIVNSLVTGAADGAYLDDPASATQLVSGPGTSVSQGPDSRVWDLMVTERGGLADPRLRKALSLALDRDGINRAGLAGLGVPAKEPVGPGAWGYEASTFQGAYDKVEGSPAKPTDAGIAAAKKLVAEVGSTKPIVVASDGTSVRGVIANAVVDAAGKIGLQASITQIPGVLSALRKGTALDSAVTGVTTFVNRIERLRTLRRGYEAHGIDVTFDLVEGAAHSGMAMLPAVERFFGALLR